MQEPAEQKTESVQILRKDTRDWEMANIPVFKEKTTLPCIILLFQESFLSVSGCMVSYQEKIKGIQI